ncbi:MAG TPA: FecR domain-containing protein [Chitinophagaceae bacterium]|nr:FecR domain-containing protein [Chitinophagaceae bacterium]
MDRPSFITLLNKYLAGNATNEEQLFVENYYKLFQNEPDVLDALSFQQRSNLRNSIQHSIEDNIIKGKNTQIRPIKFIRFRSAHIAAAIVFMMLLAAGLYFLRSTPSKKSIIASKIFPKLIKQNRVLFLPDGSTVVLSAGSKLNYPSSFEGMKKREVFLDGQAFFDIKHKASQPFIVHTGKIKTVVLGTAFNIKALDREADITVTVKRGRVKVIERDKILGIIMPNQQITYHKDKINSNTTTVNSESYLNWKEENLLLDNLTVSEAARFLGDRFNVRIKINDEAISSQRFTASFPKNETFEQALKSICVFNDLSYEYNKEKSTVTITSNK